MGLIQIHKPFLYRRRLLFPHHGCLVQGVENPVAQQMQHEGADIVIGVVETHGRAETAALIDGLKVIPRKKVNYRGTDLQEMDIEEAEKYSRGRF